MIVAPRKKKENQLLPPLLFWCHFAFKQSLLLSNFSKHYDLHVFCSFGSISIYKYHIASWLIFQVVVYDIKCYSKFHSGYFLCLINFVCCGSYYFYQNVK